MNAQTLASLTSKLQAPCIVSDILTGKETGHETRYALSALISDLQPDEAVLAITLSTQKIIAPYVNASPSMKMVSEECARLTRRYAHKITLNPLKPDTSRSKTLSAPTQCAEDLDHLKDLLDLCEKFLASKDNCGAELCNLLKRSD